MPRETSAEVPSGKTSHSFTDSDAAGASALTRSRATGWPTRGRSGGASSQVSERASSVRWSSDSPHGRWPAQSIHAVVPTDGSTASERGPASGRVDRLVGGTLGRLHPEALVEVQVGLAGGCCARTKTSHRSSCDARAPQVGVEPAGELGLEVDPGAGHGVRRVGVRPRSGQQPVRHARRGAARRRCGRCCCGSRRPTRPRASPGRRSGRSRRPGPAGPSRAPSTVRACAARSQVSSHGSASASRRRHSSSPALAPDRGHGWQRVHRRHVVAVVDQVDQPQRPTAPVHVVGPPVVGGVDRADGA